MVLCLPHLKSSHLKRLLGIGWLALPRLVGAQYPGDITSDMYNKEMRDLLERAPRSALVSGSLPIVPPRADWQLGMISWVAIDNEGLIYLLHRGRAADPLVVVDGDGRVVRSWGAGHFVMPHAVRIDPDGNVWTTDASTSIVTKFARDGRKLLEIHVGGLPADCGNPNPFCGTTDVAFGPNGRVYIADGYRNARVLEYSQSGTKLREWSTAAPGTSTFARAHSIAVDNDGVIYVADRENGRVQRFDPDGRLLGDWPRLGRPYGLSLAPDGLWVATLPVVEPWTLGFLVKVDPKSGRVLEHLPTAGIHGLHAEADQLIVAPGLDGRPLVFRRRP